jgi:hypothetical protein
MQSWLLYIIYGAFMSDRTQFEKAKQMLRTLVDVSIASSSVVSSRFLILDQ